MCNRAVGLVTVTFVPHFIPAIEVGLTAIETLVTLKAAAEQVPVGPTSGELTELGLVTITPPGSG